MRIAYVDSSIIVRRYLTGDAGHDEAIALFSDADTALITSTLAVLEVSGALVRAARNLHIEANGLLDRFDQDLADGCPTVIVADPSTVESVALKLIRLSGLRAMDALHVAAAHIAFPQLVGPGDTTAFISRDADQAAAAASLGMNVD